MKARLNRYYVPVELRGCEDGIVVKAANAAEAYRQAKDMGEERGGVLNRYTWVGEPELIVNAEE